MNRKTLTTAVLAGLAGVAGIASISNAVNLNPDGTGQVLVYPYYSAKGGNDTLISVVNTTDNAKAIKVRFVEGVNSEDVLDFNLYMSRFDVWTAAVTSTDDGGAQLITNDTSCTVPAIPDNGVAFRTAGLTGIGGTAPARGAEGYVQMFEMGTLVDDNTDDGVNNGQGSATAATHVNGVPTNCAQLTAAWTFGATVNNYWIDDATTDLLAPSGGLFGGGSIVNVIDGTLVSYDAVALDNGIESVAHFQPETAQPTFNILNDTAVVFNNGSIIESTYAGTLAGDGVNAASALFTQEQIFNEYTTGGIAQAASEWVITFPTKQFYTTGIAINPFTDTYDTSSNNPSLACEPVVISIFDREELEAFSINEPDFSPGNTQFNVPQLCYEAQVISFNNSVPGGGDAVTDFLNSDNFLNINTDPDGAGVFQNGWAIVDFDEEEVAGTGGTVSVRHFTEADTNGRVYFGLPVVGFSAVRFTNGELVDGDGNLVRSNYGGLFNHKGTRRVGTSP